MSVQPYLLPTHYKKSLGAMKADTFDRSEASPGETLYISVPKLNEHEVLVLGSLSLLFDIDLAGGHANNFLVLNVSRALVDKLVVKYADIFKIWEDLFLSQEERDFSVCVN